MLAIENFFEAAHCVSHRHLLAFAASEHLRHGKRLAEEALNFAGAKDGDFVIGRQLIHAENRDDVLQVFIALQHLLNTASDFVVFFTHDFWSKRTRCGRERIDRRIDT